MSSIVVTQSHTYRSDRAYTTPADGLTGGLPAFLDRICRPIAGVGTVLVDRWAAGQLGLPTDTLPDSGDGKRHPAALAARAAGWAVEEIYRWSRFRRDGREVNLGLLDLIDEGHCPLLWAGGPAGGAAAAGALDAWQQLAGMPYRGDPGDAINYLIMGTSRCRKNGKPLIPAWRPRNVPSEVAGLYARTFNRAGWDRSDNCTGRFRVGYDATRCYLSALSVVEVAPEALRPGPRAFDPALAGWWLAQLDPWTIPNLPEPWGYYPDGEDRRSLVWLTTPDLVLLAQLHEAGRYGGFKVHRSYVGRADRAVMRPAAERLRVMWDESATLFEDDREAVRDTIQAGYKAMHGKWRSTKGNADIGRNDWAAALEATARTNTWRRMDNAAKAGRYPAFADGIDTIYYATDHPDEPPPRGIVTERFPLNIGTPDTDKLGTYRRKYVIDTNQEKARA